MLEYEIRPAEVRDAAGVNALRTMPGVFENILGNPAERVKRSEDFLSAQGDNDFRFVAVRLGENGAEQVIGMAGLSVFSNPRTRHSGGIGLMGHRDFQNHGVGSALLEALLDMADNWLKLVRVELTVFADNQRAIHVYEKHGFLCEGVKRKAAIRRGEYADEVMMARIREKE